MKSLKLLLIIFVTAIVSCVNQNPQEDSAKYNQDFEQMLDSYYQQKLQLSPLEATRLGDTRYNDTLPNFLSDEYLEQIKSFNTAYLDSAQKYTDTLLSDNNRTSKAILEWECKINLEDLKFKDYYFPLDQMWTLNLTIAQWAGGAGAQPFETVEDYKNWLARLEDYLAWMDTAEKRMAEGMENGYLLPKSLIKKVLPQLKVMAETPLKEHLFYKPVTQFPESISDEDRKQLEKAYTQMVQDNIIPAYQELYNFVNNDYLAAGRESSGIFDTPSGKEKYQFRIKKYTTTNLTANEIFEIGLREVERIHAEMEKVKTEVGYEGDLKSFFEFVRNNDNLKPFTEPQQVLNNFKNIQNTIQPHIGELFSVVPKAGFEIRRVEAFREKSSAAHYNSPSKDGSRPGIFYVPIPNVKEYNTFWDEALFLHEAIPGHHFQIALTQENDSLPLFRQNLWYSAFGEGWALYAEALGKELGLYTDPYQYLGRLNMELHRAIRLVVDAGIHAKGWSREQAIDYSLANEAESKQKIELEIERYMANPGQALSYKIGQLKIAELRKKAEAELGDQFDVRDFHFQVLKLGCVPLNILETEILTWIEKVQQAQI